MNTELNMAADADQPIKLHHDNDNNHKDENSAVIASVPITEMQMKVEELKQFIANTPAQWTDTSEQIRQFQLPNGDAVSCVLWHGVFYITGTDIVKCLKFRFESVGRRISQMKKFEEGVFSDLRNLKSGRDASLQPPRSPFLEFLFRHNCVRTQKKQKVFYWFSVPHDRLFVDALEREMRRQQDGDQPEPASRKSAKPDVKPKQQQQHSEPSKLTPILLARRSTIHTPIASRADLTDFGQQQQMFMQSPYVGTFPMSAGMNDATIDSNSNNNNHPSDFGVSWPMLDALSQQPTDKYPISPHSGLLLPAELHTPIAESPLNNKSLSARSLTASNSSKNLVNISPKPPSSSGRRRISMVRQGPATPYATSLAVRRGTMPDLMYSDHSLMSSGSSRSSHDSSILLSVATRPQPPPQQQQHMDSHRHRQNSMASEMAIVNDDDDAATDMKMWNQARLYSQHRGSVDSIASHQSTASIFNNLDNDTLDTLDNVDTADGHQMALKLTLDNDQSNDSLADLTRGIWSLSNTALPLCGSSSLSPSKFGPAEGGLYSPSPMDSPYLSASQAFLSF